MKAVGRSLVPVLVVVAFNGAMVVFAAIATAPIGAPFFVTWFVGDFVFSCLALAFTER